MDPEALNKLSPQQKSEIMQSVKTQAALANMQMLLTQVTDKCFGKCITSPSSSLSSSEQKCLSMCMDRFMDSFNVVSRAYTNKLKNEASFQ